MEALFRAHHAAVVSYARCRVPAESVEDVVAETFLVAWRRLEQVPEPALPWLLGVARNAIGTQRRSSHRRLALHTRLRSATPELATEDSPEEAGPVVAALGRLRAKDREALTLIAWDGLSPSEAAAVLGESAGTFRVRLFRAKRRLRKLLQADLEQVDLPIPVIPPS